MDLHFSHWPNLVCLSTMSHISDWKYITANDLDDLVSDHIYLSFTLRCLQKCTNFETVGYSSEL